MFPIVGLANDSSVCYLNSLLQCLMANDKFNKQLKADKSNGILNSYLCLLNGINEHYATIQKLFKVNPAGFKKLLFSDSKFIKGRQEDADELLVHFLDKIGDNPFKNTIRTYMKCFGCGYNSQKDEDIFQLYLDIPYDDANGTNLTVYNCLNKYIKPESLCGYKCDKCDNKDETKKALLPINFGNNVVFVIKQYQTSYRRIALKTLETINLGDYLFDKYNKKQRIEKKYNLVGAILHSGSMAGGHYRAICKRGDTAWYLFDDENVEKIDDIRAIGCAYMLFYELS